LAAEGRKEFNPQDFFALTTLNGNSLLLVRQQAGEVNVSLFAVGDCCGCPTKGAADRR
jgi:hypothetical protein